MMNYTKLLVLLLLTLQSTVFAQVSGDFRSKSSGDWGDYTTWQIYSGASWANATIGQIPGGTNESNAKSVYIEAGHTVTLSSDQSCKDLYLNTNADVVRINTQDFVLNVWGKMRFYSGTTPVLPAGSPITSSGITGWISTGANGYIRFRGTANRVIMNHKEVNANNSNSGWNLDFAFDPGFTGEIKDRIRAGNITVSSGTLFVNNPTGELRIGTNNGASDVTPNGQFLVKSGATAKGGAGIFKKSNVAAESITVELGGNLILREPNFVLAAQTLNLAGTVTLLNSINFPNIVGRESTAAPVNTFNNIILDSTGAKYLLNNITVNGTLTLKETASLNTGAYSLSYGSSGKLNYNGSSSQTTTNAEFPVVNGPADLIINNSNGVTLHSGRAISNQLTLSSGLFYIGNNDFSLGTNSPSVAGTPSAANMIVTNGTGKLNKTFNSTGSYLFPIGDTTGVDEYSPANVTINSASVLDGSTYFGTRVIDTLHPSSASVTDKISRYWEVGTNMSGYSYNGTFQYLPQDVIGTESNIKSVIYTNETASSPKFAVSNVDATLHQANVNDISSIGFVSGANFPCSVLDNSISSNGQSDICSATDFVLDGQPAVVTSGNPTYQWQRRLYIDTPESWIDIENGHLEDLTETEILQAGLYQYRRIVTDPSICINGEEFSSNLLFINILQKTDILSNPSNVSTCVNSNTIFTVSAIGHLLTYKWQASIDGGATYHDLLDGSIHSNTSSATLNITNAPISINNYKYRCKITGTCGTIYTIPATLSVNLPPSIVKNVTNKSICEGNNLTFGVQLTGGSLVYQWEMSSDGGTTYVNLSETTTYVNVNTPTLSIVNTSASQNGFKYRCKITSAPCSTSVTSDAATLTVFSLPSITLQPNDISSCQGGNFNLSTAATGSNITYQWQVSVNGGVSFTNISNGSTYSNTQSATLTVSSVSSSMNNYIFRCKITGQCSTIYSNPAQLTLTSAIITSNPQNKYVCPGTHTNFSVLASGNGLSYQWQVSSNGGTTYTTLTENATYSNVNSAVLGVTGVQPTMNNYKYRCIVTANCGAPMVSTAATLYLFDALSITLNPSNQTVNAGSNASFTVAASGQEISYLWYVSTDGGNNYFKLSNGSIHSNVTTSTLNITSASLGMNNYKYKCKITSKCSSEFSGVGTLSVMNGGAKLANYESNFEVHAYPNPFEREISIAVSGREDVNLILRDLSGREILNQDNVQSNSIVTIGQDLEPGTYILEIISSDERKTIKVIKN